MDIRTFCRVVKAKQFFNYLLITEHGVDFNRLKSAEVLEDSKFLGLMITASEAAGFTFTGLESCNGCTPSKLLEWLCAIATVGGGSPFTVLQQDSSQVINLKQVLEQGNVCLANGKFWFTTKALPEDHLIQNAELPTFDMQRVMIEAVLFPDCASFTGLFADVVSVHTEMRSLCQNLDNSGDAKNLVKSF